MERSHQNDIVLANYLLATGVVVELATGVVVELAKVASHACRTSGNGRSLDKRVVALVYLNELIYLVVVFLQALLEFHPLILFCLLIYFVCLVSL